VTPASPEHNLVAVSEGEGVEAGQVAGQPTVAQPGTERPAPGTRLKSAARIAAFDVVGPLIAYALLRKTGLSAVTALILSGVLPAIGVTTNAIQRRRLDIIGVVVLGGIVVGAVLGLVSHDARLVLLEGSVPTAVFGLACLSSLRAPKPLLFGFAHEFVGPDSAKGREMTRLWQFAGYQRAYRVVTAVWGAGYLVEAGVRVAIVENTSTGTALVASKILPYVSAAILAGWTAAYARYQWRKA
jgi:intracellular septation protein A